MNRKTIIQVAVIVCAFVASGIVIYKGLMQKSSPPPPPVIPGFTSNSSSPLPNPASSGSAAQVPVDLGPKITVQNDNLESSLKILDINGLQYGLITYPDLAPEAEVGVPVSDLISPIVAPDSGESE